MQQTKQLKDLTIVELKAEIYDRGVLINTAQKEIEIINQELASRQQEFTQPATGTEPVKTEEVTSTNDTKI